ncbi:MAG: ferredoxin family protein [Deltaproteobacteria bacterium]|nr:ferredoxin family protein [Deltaproteobacteria bacterium]MBW2306488.1 ferredoxin family protein [Deltaproteobacteria bacterium]
MRIDPEKCISCLECVDLCPMNCIMEGDQVVRIDEDECVECGVCLKAGVCPVDAIYMPEESKKYPRSIRAMFSDPDVQYPGLNQGGRGTEEMKTNDVTGRYRRGEYGMALEFGRPGTGTRIAEIEKVAKVVCPMDVHIEEANPVYHLLLADTKTGKMKPEVLQEKVLSAILEIKIKEEQLEEIINKLTPVLEQVDTVVSWGLVTRFAEDGTLPVRSRLKYLGIPVRPNAKINMGLGRPIVEE